MKKYITIALFIGILAPAQKVWSLQDCLDYAVKNNITVKKTALDKTTAQINNQQQKNNKPSLMKNFFKRFGQVA